MFNEVIILTSVDVSSDTWGKNPNAFPIEMIRPSTAKEEPNKVVTVIGIRDNNHAIESDNSSHGHIGSYKIKTTTGYKVWGDKTHPNCNTSAVSTLIAQELIRRLSNGN